MGLLAHEQLMKQHNYWKRKGIACDLVMITHDLADYFREFIDTLSSVSTRSIEPEPQDSDGQLHLPPFSSLRPEDSRC